MGDCYINGYSIRINSRKAFWPMTYFVYLDNGYASDFAECAEEAKQEARQYFIEMLQKGEGEFVVEQE